MQRRKIPFRFVPIPKIIIDEWLSVLSPSEFLCYAAISRKTYGFDRAQDAIALSQFVEITGLSRRTAQRALEKLRKRGLIRISGSPRHVRKYEILMPRNIDFERVTHDATRLSVVPKL